jgi:hypothetical protein
MVALSDRQRARQRVAEFNASKAPHPNAEGIADDGGDENDEHRRPAAKVVKNHRMNTVAALAAARTEKERERKP